jgi:hypothetical protein
VYQVSVYFWPDFSPYMNFWQSSFKTKRL